MMVTLDGQLTPGSYEPLRFTFLIWVMVIVGGSGNNWGAVLGGIHDLVPVGPGRTRGAAG
jgi:branched-chain amino acid transport system permease protein